MTCSTCSRRPCFTVDRKAGDAGFALLELLVVIVIIDLLAAYVGPQYFTQIGGSERGAAKAQVKGFGKALDAHRPGTGSYPTSERSLRALVTRPNWSAAYLQKDVLPDPWVRAHIYRSPGQGGGDFVLLSYGQDGQSPAARPRMPTFLAAELVLKPR